MKRAKTSLLLVAALGLLVLCGSAWAADGMVSYWRFDESEGTTAFDSVGANDGTLKNGPLWANGLVGGALEFDGVNDYVEVADSASLDFEKTNPFSTELWYNHDDTGDTSLIQKMTTNLRGWHIYTYADRYYVEIRTSSTERAVVNKPNIINQQWTHLGMTYDGYGQASGIKLYINGAEETLIVVANNMGTTILNDASIQIGRFWDGNHGYYYKGQMDEVAIYNSALSAEEIQQHYWNGLHGQGYLAIEVAIDIKPGSYPNTINLGSKGLIPVAILSSEDFDATSVDPDTVELGGSGVAVRGKGNRFMAHEEDVNADGLLDLVVQVATANLDPDSFQDGYAVLTGSTYGGLPIWGVDEIIIVPSGE